MPEINDDLGLLIRATQFATQRHRDQKRKDEITPYITHPIALAATLSDAGVRDVNVLAAALLHDTIEDTDATYDDIRGEFGKQIADLVAEVTDVKFLETTASKKLQVSRAGHASERAKVIKLADKICNLRDILSRPPADWSLQRRQEYFDWARDLIGRVRGTNANLERTFDRLYLQRP